MIIINQKIMFDIFVKVWSVADCVSYLEKAINDLKEELKVQTSYSHQSMQWKEILFCFIKNSILCWSS